MFWGSEGPSEARPSYGLAWEPFTEAVLDFARGGEPVISQGFADGGSRHVSAGT